MSILRLTGKNQLFIGMREKGGAARGIRTLDILNHNQAL